MAAAHWLLTFVAAAALLGQAPDRLSFEVVSIKPSKNFDQGGGTRWQPGGILHGTNAAVRDLITSAYGTSQRPLLWAQIIGAPDWAVTDRYDITAKVEASLAGLMPAELYERQPALLRSLLADRFKLKIHRDTRELPVFVVRIADRDGRLGPQLRRSIADCERERGKCVFRPLAGHGSGIGVDAETIVRFMTSSLERVVINKTGLTGKYDVDIEWSPDQTSTDKPSLFAAAREQLGLRIDSERAPVDVVVIDHVEKPTEN